MGLGSSTLTVETDDRTAELEHGDQRQECMDVGGAQLVPGLTGE